ncbi:MAG: M43 family zinc metalloprotease [Bacteroidota bacterium]|nr:M43 family zinc metalloprotease [Bacteroidota bacterium]
MKSFLYFNLLLIVVGLSNHSTNGQLCLTSVDSARFQYEINNPQNFKTNSITQNKRIFHIRIHLFADATGSYGISDSLISNCIFNLNNDFAPSGISFVISKIDSIEYCQYSIFSFPAELGELKILYYKAGIINLFLVDEINNEAGNNLLEGYTEFPGNDDLIIIPKGFLVESGLSHQMGHFFGLYHTFEDMFGHELPGAGNCTIAGDLLCDTPADTLVAITPDCNSTATVTPDGEGFTPPVSNNMSNWPECRCRFTIQQYNKMAHESKTTRAYLW